MFWIPIGKFLSINNTLSTGLNPMLGIPMNVAGVGFNMNFAYSLVLAAIGACLALVQSLMIICYLWRNPRVTRGEILSSGAPMESLPHGMMTSPYNPSGYTVTVTSGPVPAGIPPLPPTMSVGPMDSVSQPLASEFGAKHSLLQNPEVNC